MCALILDMPDEVFVGRRDELGRFEAMLRGLPRSKRAWALLPSWRRGRHKKEPAHVAESPVVLVYGLGGSGKTRLLLQFQQLASPVTPGSPLRRGSIRTVWLDWATEQGDRPDQYRDMGGPTLVTVLDAVVTRVVSDPALNKRARERTERAFTDYRNGVSKLEEFKERFAEVITRSEQAGSPFTKDDAATLLKSMSSIGLALAHHPTGALGLTPAMSASTAQAAVHLSEAAARAVTGKKPGDISQNDYNLVIDASRELIRRVADGLRAVARVQPLVMLLDTGEVLSPVAWNWLRQLMALTGPSIAWVVGARFEAESESGPDSPIYQFSRKIGDAHLKRMPLTRFDDATIGEYLSRRTGAGSYSSAQIGMVAKLTRGLPLAVSLVADLIHEGQNIDDIYRETAGDIPDSIVSTLARRYLFYAERRDYSPSDPRRMDLQRILALALGFRDAGNDHDYLSKLWETDQPLDVFHELAQRHDFVLPVSRRLHDDVQVAIRSDLLDPLRRERVRQVNQRALEIFKERLAKMRLRLPALDDQVANEEFKTTLLAALWHAFWIDNQSGLDLLIDILPVLAVVSPGAGNAAAAVADKFIGTFDADQRNTISLFTAAPEAAGADVLVSSQHGLAQLAISQFISRERTEDSLDSLSARLMTLNIPNQMASLLAAAGDLEMTASLAKLSAWVSAVRSSKTGVRTVRYTERGLNLKHPGIGADIPLIGDWNDRDAAIAILGAVLALKSDEKEKARTAERLILSQGKTKSSLLRLRIDLILKIIPVLPS